MNFERIFYGFSIEERPLSGLYIEFETTPFSLLFFIRYKNKPLKNIKSSVQLVQGERD